MRLLIVTGIYPPAIGGSATYSALLARELPKRGFEVRVLTYGNISEKGIFYVSNRWSKGLRHLIYFLKLLKLAYGSDRVLAADSSFGAATIAALVCRLLGRKFVVRVTGDYAWEQGIQRFGVRDLIDEFQSKKYGWLVGLLGCAQSFAVKNAAVVIAPSEYLGRIAIGWGANQQKVKVINNAVDLPVIEKACQAAEMKQSYAIISAGRLVLWKGFEVLMEVIAELRQDIPEIKLLIIGDGPEREKLLEKIKNLNSNNHDNLDIRLIRSLTKFELAREIAGADVFVLNTAYEGFSHQIVEVMSLGVPVITTNVGGNPEIIKDGENGLLFDYNDKKAMKSAIIRLYKDRECGERLGMQGVKLASQYTKDVMLDKFVILLKNL